MTPAQETSEDTEAIMHTPVNGFNLHELQAVADMEPLTAPYKPLGGRPEPRWPPDCMADGNPFFKRLDNEYLHASQQSPSAEDAVPTAIDVKVPLEVDPTKFSSLEVYRQLDGDETSRKALFRCEARLDWGMESVMEILGMAGDIIQVQITGTLEQHKQESNLGMTLAVVLFQDGDRRNDYLCQDALGQWRLPRVRDLFTANELETAVRTQRPVIVKVIMKLDEATESAWIQTEQRTSQPTFFCYGAGHKEISARQQELAKVEDNKVIEYDLMDKKLSIWDESSPRKLLVDQGLTKLYPVLPQGFEPPVENIYPLLSFNTFTPASSAGPCPNHRQISLLVRVINHLHATELAGIELPANWYIHLPPTGKTSGQIKSALKKALNDRVSELDAGKGPSDAGRVQRLLEHGGSKKWEIELWVTPQRTSGIGRLMYRWESGNVVQYFRPDGEGQKIYMEAHFVPVYAAARTSKER